MKGARMGLCFMNSKQRDLVFYVFLEFAVCDKYLLSAYYMPVKTTPALFFWSLRQRETL